MIELPRIKHWPAARLPFAQPAYARGAPVARGGFTLIELLVVIAIIGILISLTLPALMAARDAGRRMQCANNLKQLATAVQTFEAKNRVLPAGGTFAPPAEAAKYSDVDIDGEYIWTVDMRSGSNYSWIVQILPDLEAGNIYDQFDRSQRIFDNVTQPQANHIETLLCPADDAGERYFEIVDIESQTAMKYAKGNYAAFVNPYHTNSFYFSGPINLYSQPMSQVTDGSAYTIMLSEVRTRDDAADQRGAWALPWSGASLLAYDMHPASASSEGDCADWRCHMHQFKSPTPPSRAGIGSYHPWWGSIGYTQHPNGPHPDVLYECPNPEAAQFEQMPCVRHKDARYMSAAARSQHLGGVNVAFLDGHVTFISNGVNETAMAIMISANDHLEPGETF